MVFLSALTIAKYPPSRLVIRFLLTDIVPYDFIAPLFSLLCLLYGTMILSVTSSFAVQFALLSNLAFTNLAIILLPLISACSPIYKPAPVENRSTGVLTLKVGLEKPESVTNCGRAEGYGKYHHDRP